METLSACTVVRSGETFAGRQGLTYGAGISAETAGARALCLHRLSMPAGARANAHLHADHESAIFGRGECWWEQESVVLLPHLDARLSPE